MRIALVIERFEPDTGGAETSAWNIAHGLARGGDEVHVVARRGRDSPSLQLHRVRVPAAWQPLRVLAFSQAAARVVRRSQADCCLSFSRTLHQDVYRAGGGSHADYMKRRYGARSLLRRLSPRHAILLAIERRIFRDPRQRVIAISRMVEAEIRGRYGVAGDRCAVVYNGVDLERFHPKHRAGSGQRLRNEFGVGPVPVWLFAGSGFARKGIDTALRALANDGTGETLLWVAGRDDPRPWQRVAKKLGVAHRVRFLGFRRDIENVYAAADALLLPTRYDAFGNACLEAAATGLPVVTSGAAGAAELFRGLGGVVEDPEDAAGFAAVLKLLADAPTRERVGAAARHVAEAYGWDTQVAVLRRQLVEFAA